MPKTSPWHSDRPGIEVYHNNTNCNTGNNIEKENVKPGAGGKRLCDECERLNKEGK